MATYFTYIIGIINVAILALGLGIAALTTKTNRKGWAISGIVMSSIMITGYIGFMILGWIGLLMEQQGMLPMSG